MTSLYVHIPFCAKKCAYCDFPSFAGETAKIDAYLGALEREADAYRGLRFDTVYFGGGTPTMLSPGQIARLLEIVRSRFAIAPDAEISSESNPGTLNPDKLRALRGGGVNRLSIGAQAMQDALLKTLGRIHCADDVPRSVELAQQAGFSDINLDLMYGLPGQTPDMMEESVRRAAETGVTHISAYSLICEEGTLLTKRIEAGELTVPDEDGLAAIESRAREALRELGYGRYEISNYAKPGYTCRHNLAYWTRTDYLGIGLSAHSFMNGERFANTCVLDDYIGGTCAVTRETIGKKEAEYEQIMLETRLARGLDICAFRVNFGVDFYEKYRVPVGRLVQSGCAEADARYFRLTEKGLDLQNSCVIVLTDYT